MSELRTFNIQAHVEGKSGLTELTQITKAVKDVDAATEALKKQLGEETQVTVNNVKTKKELTAEARRVVEQVAKTEKATERLTKQYQDQAKMIGMTANEAEQYRAVMALGSKATDAQREQVRQSVAEYQRLRDSMGTTQGSFRDARGIMQNFGWQMQDTIVQLQMGTSAFTVLSQQGSQMAAAFGPTGALVGALIALAGVIGGTLFTSLRQSAKATADFKKEIDGIASSTEKLGKAQAELKRQQLGADINELTRRWQNTKKAVEGTERVYANAIKTFKNAGRELDAGQVKFFTDQITASKAELEEIEAAFKKAGVALSVLYGGQNTEQLKAYNELIADLNKEYLSTSENTEATKRATQDLSIMMMGLNDEQQKVVDGLLKRNRAQEDGIEAAKKRAEIEKQELTQFEALNVKLTKTIDDEYKRRYAVIKAYSDNVGADQKAVAKAYADLEAWKTHELDKESDKRKQRADREYNDREAIRRQIERAQVTQAKKDDPLQGEIDQFGRNLLVLAEQKRQTDALGEAGLAERQRINALIEAEVLRHNSAMEAANLTSFQNTVSVFAMAQTQVASIVNLMTTGVQDVRNQMAEMNGFQKAMFLTAQVVAAANAVVSGIDLGMKLAAMFPLAAPAMIATGTGIGAAQAGTIMGVTLAGAFDKGGYIPQGQAGIVAEYGNELVNGQLVMGPANVTSREDTAAMMNGSTKLNVSIENRISGAGYQVKQIDENTVKIIAEQVFANNIDQGVSQVISNGNSKTAKSMRQSYNVQRNLNGN